MLTDQEGGLVPGQCAKCKPADQSADWIEGHCRDWTDSAETGHCRDRTDIAAVISYTTRNVSTDNIGEIITVT